VAIGTCGCCSGADGAAKPNANRGYHGQAAGQAGGDLGRLLLALEQARAPMGRRSCCSAGQVTVAGCATVTLAVWGLPARSVTVASTV
jgi:hypothetical protein